MEKQTLRQVLADYYDVPAEDVAPELFDPAVKFLKEGHEGPSEAGIWVLDPDAQKTLLDYLEKRSSGQLIEEGEAEADPWDEFVYWAQRFYELPGFDQNERDYKLEISENINRARAAMQADAEDWPQLLKKAFGPPNNLTHYITHSRFQDWVASDRQRARDSILNLWDESQGLSSRIDVFAAALPDEIASSGARLQVASFLLMSDPINYVIFRPSDINKVVDLTEFGEDPTAPESARYTFALEFFDHFISEAAQRRLVLRDRLDAQSLVWVIAKSGPPKEWSEEEAEAFLRYRGERPQIWWVNQGETYGGERAAGVVTAPPTSKAGHVLQHHKNVSLLRKGDVILHHAAGHVRAISDVTHKPEIRPRPTEPDGPDYRVTRTHYYDLANPIEVREMDAEQRSSDAGPFDKYGGVKQVYLVPISVEFSGWIRESYGNRWPEGSPWAPKQRDTWLFQANPKVWDLRGRLDEMELGEENDFLIVRFKTEYAIGDRVLLWSSGSNAGLYGMGEISGELYERGSEDEESDDADPELAIRWRLTRKVDPPILRSDLIDHPVLKGLSVITAPQGSNFRVTDEQWSELRSLLDREVGIPEPVAQERSLSEIGMFIANQGLIISDRTLRRFHVSLRTRGFVILSGISGTGKTWLSDAYAEAVGAEYLLVPVAPNWTTNEDLLGYLNPLDGQYHDTVFSGFLREAAKEYEAAIAAEQTPRSFILTLDEMNLARVEYYFAKFLSGMEVRIRRGTAQIELAPDQTVALTPNLLFIGTVNVDETTHGFADKVFDRAQLIEMEAPREAIAQHIGSAAFRDSLLEVWDAVEDAKPFAFRVVDDVKAYVGESESLGVEWQEAVDEQILQKVLPKLTGADPAVRFALDRLVELCDQHGFELTKAKAERMADLYERDGFTSYF